MQAKAFRLACALGRWTWGCGDAARMALDAGGNEICSMALESLAAAVARLRRFEESALASKTSLLEIFLALRRNSAYFLFWTIA
jgi:hypothetical protein